jgi:LysM repeat protein
VFKESLSNRNLSRPGWVGLVAAIILLALPVITGAVPPGLVQTGATIRLLASSQQINVGETTSVNLQVDNVTGLYGVEIVLTFDSALLEVQDGDPGNDGVQMALGHFVSPDFVILNAADNATGQAKIAFTQIAPHAPVNGSGVLATVVFRAKQPGVASLGFQKTLFSNTDGMAISVSPVGTSLTVGTGQPSPTVTLPPGPTPTQMLPTVTPGPGQPTPTATLVPNPTPTQTSPTATPQPGGFFYTVRAGDNLFRIALRFGTTIRAIAQANGIVNARFIRVGQVLWIPVPGSSPSTVYIVQRGDTLYSIARRFGTTYQEIAAANGLRDPRLIYVGQRLVIPGATSPGPMPPIQTIHTVRRGDTLWSIALRYGTTPWAIAAANGLRNPNLIYAGQQLIIP